jgi:hypothetical protein
MNQLPPTTINPKKKTARPRIPAMSKSTPVIDSSAMTAMCEAA